MIHKLALKSHVIFQGFTKRRTQSIRAKVYVLFLESAIFFCIVYKAYITPCPNNAIPQITKHVHIHHNIQSRAFSYINQYTLITHITPKTKKEVFSDLDHVSDCDACNHCNTSIFAKLTTCGINEIATKTHEIINALITDHVSKKNHSVISNCPSCSKIT